ncbi:hypothetical protein EV426DRAFT_561727 [Tirmania nivea]|nr:hypothetical protein EV426DRAFT_561727 [Tirmania nivea]
MGKKDKKKNPDRKARVAEKTSRKLASKEKKTSKKGANGEEVDPDDVDIDTVLAEYARQQALYHKVTETILPAPPPPRANATLTPSPSNPHELFLFGGELFNGALASFYNDLFIYNSLRNEWKQITSPNSPLPRSGHWITQSGGKSGVGGGKGALWLFGGEFSSPKQGTFYHYSDFWRLDCEAGQGGRSVEWEKIEPKGGSRGGNPPSRSGHRMVAWKQFIILFGGFQDTSQTTKYLNDLWLFDTSSYTWILVQLPAHAQRPDVRSSFSFLPHEAGAVLYGGYSRVRSASTSAGSSSRHQIATKPVVHTDSWLLRVSPNDPAKLTRWERRKKPANAPNPPRVGVTMTGHKGRGIMFGGVYDTEKDEEGLESQFFDDMFAWGVERNRFFPLTLRKPRGNQPGRGNARGKQAGVDGGAGGGKRDRAKEDAEELLRNLARLEASSGLDSSPPTSDTELDPLPEAEPEVPKVEGLPVSFTLPHPRFNAALAVQEDTLYIYGGTFEKGDREFTFDEMYAVDLVKLDGLRTLFARKDEIAWVEDEEDEEDEGEEDEDEDDEDEEGEESGAEMDSKAAEIARKKAEGQARKLKEQEEAAAAEEATQGPAAEDTTPFPRPFESLRDFFARSSQVWQEIILANAANAEVDVSAGAGKTVKELRKAAFAASEERWWAVREEVRAAEDEQEESGIGEVVSLKDREASGAGGGAGVGGAGRRR